MKTLGEKGAWT